MESSLMTAVKFFDGGDRFKRELEVYSLLRERDIRMVAGHNVPWLVNSVPSLAVLEMTLVTRPFVLDFAGAKLSHEVPDFREEIMAEHHEHLRELFDDRWTVALHVADMFRIATGYTLLISIRETLRLRIDGQSSGQGRGGRTKRSPSLLF